MTYCGRKVAAEVDGAEEDAVPEANTDAATTELPTSDSADNDLPPSDSATASEFQSEPNPDYNDDVIVAEPHPDYEASMSAAAPVPDPDYDLLPSSSTAAVQIDPPTYVVDIPSVDYEGLDAAASTDVDPPSDYDIV